MTTKASLFLASFAMTVCATPLAQAAGGPQSCFDNEQWDAARAECVCVAGTLRAKGDSLGTRQPCVDEPAAEPEGVSISLGGDVPGADRAEHSSPELPARVPWRGTSFSWITGATTTALGLGRDNIGDSHESVGMLGLINLRYHLVDLDAWSMGIKLGTGFAVELTNSDSTVTQNEPQLLDLGIGPSLSYKRAAKKWGTTPSLGAALVFPTSKASRANGTHLKTQLGGAINQSFPWFGGVPVAEDLSLSFALRWDHRASSATTPVDDDLNRPRQQITGGSVLDDQLTGGRFARNALRENVSLNYGHAFGGLPVSAGLGIVFGQHFKPAFEKGAADQCIPIANVVNEDCTVLAGVDAATTDTIYSFGFSAEVGVRPAPELDVTLSYSSSASSTGQNSLAPNGKRQDFFYSPSAEFALVLTFHPDALYERFTGPKRKLAETETQRRTF
jgi:hypothetical protein